MTKRSAVLPALAALALAALSAGCASTDDDGDGQAEVRKAGARVMPFDLDKTKHSFVKTNEGGVQTVVSLDPADTEQVELVRQHLTEIRSEFAAGRFDDPTSIHGSNMPGVAQLAAGVQRLNITYRDVDGDGEITYRTYDGSLVGALHDWFDAQVSDHGSDAVSEPFGHTMTEEMWRQHHPGRPYPSTTDGNWPP